MNIVKSEKPKGLTLESKKKKKKKKKKMMMMMYYITAQT